MATRKDTKGTKGIKGAHDIKDVRDFQDTQDPRGDKLALQVEVQAEGQEAPPPMAVYAYTHQGQLLAGAPVSKGIAQLLLPAGYDGRTVDLVLGPPPPADGRMPDKAALLRAGAFKDAVRVLKDKPLVRIPLTPDVLTTWCICRVRGRVVKRVPAPGGGTVERPVCHTRVHVMEVDRITFVIDRLPELDLYRLRDELLRRLQEVPVRPGPIPQPDPAPFALRSATMAMVEPRALATAHSAAHLRASLKLLSPQILFHLCDLPWLYGFLHADEVLVLDGQHDGSFGGWLVHACSDQPDLYFWVEQFRNGAWSTVYRPRLGCGTYWNYVCGTEIVLHAPGADACEEPEYDLPDGVTLFVTPWSVGRTPIWGQAPGTPAAWVRPDGLLDYDAGAPLGVLEDAPFGGVLNFHHDDSWFIPSAATPITYYRYSVRPYSSAANTGADDTSWTPLLVPQARGYRLEYSDRLPTYQALPVGPDTVGGRQGMFRFRPQQPPNPGGTVVASEWTTGTPDEVAATWDTTVSAPGMSDDITSDASGPWQVKLEVFDQNGVLVPPGAGTFQFLLLDAPRTGSRLADGNDVQAGAFVMTIAVDNNRCSAALPMPSIRGVGPNPACGFMHYDQPDDPVQLRFVADHPHDRAVFSFGVIRGATGVPVATTNPTYAETSATFATTTGAQYDLQTDGHYAHEFRADALLGGCMNAAFAATLGVHAKATNGHHRLGGGLDAGGHIAFALAQSGS